MDVIDLRQIGIVALELPTPSLTFQDHKVLHKVFFLKHF